jgi:hypothetical protein
MGAVAVPAVGDTGVASYADDVANQINQMHAFMTLVNPNVNSPGAGTATWVTMGNITVPTWATRGRVSLTANGCSAASLPAAADIAVKIGSSTGAAKRWTATVAVGTSRLPTLGLNDLLTSVPTGSQSVTVQATFAAGTLTAASTFCSFDLNIDWMQ